jgi:hypothetical protein
MKHLKKFNESNYVQFTIVTFEMGDWVKALYIDGDLYKSGDEYHHNITVYLDAFIEGVEYAGGEIEVNNIKCTNEVLVRNICENGDSVPNKLSDIKSDSKKI